jgi:hypothetical protein
MGGQAGYPLFGLRKVDNFLQIPSVLNKLALVPFPFSRINAFASSTNRLDSVRAALPHP